MSAFQRMRSRRSTEKSGARSLRSSLAMVTITVVSLALLVAGALVMLTTVLHQTTSRAANAVESVRLAYEAQNDLLLYSRSGDAVVRRDLDQRIRRRLVDARRFVTSAHEDRLIAQAEADVKAYMDSPREASPAAAALGRREASAYAALDALVDFNVEHAREAYDVAETWNWRANYVGFGMATLLLLSAASVLLWLRRALAPLFSLARAMQRFGEGQRDVRVEETGPSELQEMNRRFNEMAGALALQQQAQIAFLGGIAHDLRTPLSVLKLAMPELRAETPLPPELQLRRTLAKIQRQIGNLERMASDFVDIAKIEAGELDLQVHANDARALTREVVELFQGTSPSHHLRLQLPDQDVFVRCDRLRIEQVLTNLISNAIKYSPRDSTIDVVLEAGPDEVVFQITDRGMGISETDRERLFEPFRRVGLSKETVPGVGLGLFVVRRIVEAHQGNIAVLSTLGVGSTFSVRLPLHARKHAHARSGCEVEVRGLPQ